MQQSKIGKKSIQPAAVCVHNDMIGIYDQVHVDISLLHEA